MIFFPTNFCTLLRFRVHSPCFRIASPTLMSTLRSSPLYTDCTLRRYTSPLCITHAHAPLVACARLML